MSDYIAKTVLWLRKNSLTSVVLEGSGGGDSGSIEDVTVYRTDDKVADGIDLPDDLKDGLESDATDLADWDWCNDDGGTIRLEVRATGHYEVTGGWYESKLVDADPTTGEITDDELQEWADEDEDEDEDEDDDAPEITLNLTPAQADEVSRILFASGTPVSREVASLIEDATRNTR
jgi:hypothetical protein